MATDFARMITRPQLAKVHILFNELGVSERAERLSRVSAYIGREIESTSDLSLDEASLVIEWLLRGGKS